MTDHHAGAERAATDEPDELEYLRAAIRSQLFLVARWRADDVVSWVSPSSKGGLWFDPDELLGFDPDSFLTPDYRPTRDRNVRQLTPEPPSYVSESPMVLPDGSRPWVRRETRGFFRDRRLVALQMIGIDISDTRRALEGALASERRLTSILEHLDDAIILIDIDGHLTWVCPIIVRTFGPDLGTVAKSAYLYLDEASGAAVRSAF